jgi:spermidine/putrescine transport system substrate-binding protein
VNPAAHPPDPLTRRSFLGRAAGAGAAVSGLGGLLAGCGLGSAAPPKFSPLPQPRRPVKWPILAANQPIPGGQLPESNATLRLFAWAGRVSQRCLDDFAKAYRCDVELTSYTSMMQALRAVLRGKERFDVFMGAPTDTIGTLVGKARIQPLNHSYIPNIREAWPVFTDPYYDSHWLYTVPYSVFTTGIAWRKDHVDIDPYAMQNGWQFPWKAASKGKTAVLDDYRESIGLALLRDNDRSAINSSDPLLINQARDALLDLDKLVGLRIDNDTAAQLASGQTWIHHAWSGQVVAAAKKLPPGVPIGVLGYWFPPEGAGPVANDTNTILRGAQNPVLAHLFLNFMLARNNALHNIAATGFTQPLTYATPSRLVYLGILPSSLTSAAVLSTYLDHGLKELQVPPAVDMLWRQAWRTVTKHA